MQTVKLFMLSSLMIFSSITLFAQKKITVAAAANVQFVLEEIRKNFETETGISMNIILNSSGKLTAQIKEGAPYDVFVSADMKYPQELYRSGFATGAPKVYGNGVLVLWTTRADVKPSTDLKLLATGEIKKIAIANPQTAPYGVAAEEAMKYSKVYEQVKNKLVFGESISQTNQYILSQSADIGFTAKSIVLSDDMKNEGTWADVAPQSYTPIQQGAVILKHGNETNKEATQKFYNYLYSAKAKNVFKKFGYLVN
jgi:molybdate transport system substrate-binding protein